MKTLRDRNHAGTLLAEKLSRMHLGDDVCVLALPRGGAPVALRIAEKLKCPLDMFFIKKIGAPQQPEFAIGAVTEYEISWQQQAIDYLKIPQAKLAELAAFKQNELMAQLNKWRKILKPVDVTGKTVIVVDDGLATGAIMIAALRCLRHQNPKRLIVAVPIASESAYESIAALCDDVVTLQTPSPFFSVGQWYWDFTQITDEEMERLFLSGSDDHLNKGKFVKKRVIVVAERSRIRIYGRKPFFLLKTVENELGREKNRAMTVDKPGSSRTNFSGSSNVHAMTGEKNPHDDAANQFARSIGQCLEREDRTYHFDEILVIAEPKFLGKIRAALPKQIMMKCEWLNKDYGHLSDHEVGKTLGLIEYRPASSLKVELL